MNETASLYNFDVCWEPFLLRPEMPDEGVEKPPEYQSVSKSGHLYKSGASVGLDFTGKCKRFPNTVLGHTFLEYLKQVDDSHRAQNLAVEMLFQAYFTDGVYPDRQLMDAIASKLDLDLNKYREYMDNSANMEAARSSALQWRDRVQTGVPYFVINGQPTFSGAQDTDTFVKVFATIAKRMSAGNL